MNTPNLEDLAVRVELASGPDRGVDADIELAIGNWSEQHHEAWWHYEAAGESANPPLHQPAPPQCFTASLDAAMTLLDQYGVLLHLSDIGADGLPYARVGRPDLDEAPIFTGISSGVAKDATPTSGLALALCAAALRARSEYKGGEG